MNRLERNPSQEDRALALLKLRDRLWTPAPELAKISLQYCRVIACLRKRGYQIENRVETHDGVRHGFYRLAAIAPSQPKPPLPTPDSLFGDLSPDRSYRE
jgi:hypothetical protein